jgi:hypothetical protein
VSLVKNGTPVPSVKRLSRSLRSGLGRVGVAVLVVLAGVVVAGDVRAARTNAVVSPSDAAAIGDNSRERATDVSRALSSVLAGQDQAMYARDEAGFVQVGATSDATAALQLRYRNLAAMQVAEYHVTASFPRPHTIKGQWTSSLSIEFCFGVRGCNRDTVIEESVWRDTAGGPVLVSLKPSPSGDDQYQHPHPWELTPLSVLLGRKVVLATSEPLKDRLPALLAEIEKAIPVAEQYAVGAKPDYYRVYLASASDQGTWFGGKGDADLGLAIETGPFHGDVVLNSAAMPTYPLAQLLRHELTHVVSIYGVWRRHSWWLMEGYAANAEHGLSFSTAPETRAYIHGEWNHVLPELPPADNATASVVNARYGVAFLAVHRLEMKYGRASLIKFFQQVIRYGGTPEMASPDIFGAPWSTVEADCIKYVKAF